MKAWVTFQTALRQHFLLRWTLANLIGWTLALLGVSLGARLGQAIGGLLFCAPLLALFGAGALAGAAVALCQGWALRGGPAEPGPLRPFVLWSAVGGALGALPVFLLSITLVFNLGVGGALIGAAYAGILAALQTSRLPADLAPRWIAASAAAGLLCGAVSTAIPLLGPVLFGLITGWALIGTRGHS